MVRQNAVNTKEQTLQQADEMTVTVNTKYKDTVFRMLFSDKMCIRDRYCEDRFGADAGRASQGWQNCF